MMMVQLHSSPSWYVLHTKSRAENVVNEGLAKKQVEVFLPKITVQSRRKDRRKMIRLPLFPGYLFVKTDLSPRQHLEIVKTAGAVKLVGNSQGPIPVTDETILSLQIMVATDAPITTGFMFKRGDPVMVVSGPFSGIIGIFDHYRGKGRIIVHIEALGQFASVEVDAGDVEKVPEVLSR
jgi:transcription termination/antitermination protein NusG